MGGRLLLCLVVSTLVGACGTKKVETTDAAPPEILTPGGYANPGNVKKKVEDTLEKEHEKTLEPKVE